MADWSDENEPVADKMGPDMARQLGTPPLPLKNLLVGLILLFSIIALSGLGVWQVQRRAWKLDLIERVEQRVRATPTDAPGPESWPNINASDYAYRHVSVRGQFVKGRSTLVRAVTERGRGYWLVEPLRAAEGFTVLINRGFVAADRMTRNQPADTQTDRITTITGLLRMTEPLQAAQGFTVLINRGFIPADRITRSPPGRERLDAVTTVTGLLRMTEPGGGFLHQNDPTSGRWYSRDVAAIANAQSIERVAPYFIDADASVTSSDLAVGGLTVISFPNNHLIYALTWFGLAAMLSAWTIYFFCEDWQRRRYLGVSHGSHGNSCQPSHS